MVNPLRELLLLPTWGTVGRRGLRTRIQAGAPFVNGLKNLNGVTLIRVMTTHDPTLRWLFGNPVTKIMFRGAFRKIGVRRLLWLNHTNPSSTSLEERQVILQGIEARFAAI